METFSEQLPPTVITNLDQIQDGQIISIKSATFDNVFLRMDGSGVTKATAQGQGSVNCQFGAYEWEQFRICRHPFNAFTFESVAHPGVYLRMDGKNVVQDEKNGAGTVNCQFGYGPYEFFTLTQLADSIFGIESALFDRVYLRMDGSKADAFSGTGAGTVNCQFGAVGAERFYLVVHSSPPA